MQNLMSLLSKKYKHHLVYAHAVEAISTKWTDLVGDLSSNIKPVNIYKNQLVIECSNPVWLSELDYFKDTILTKVQGILNQKKIKCNLIGIKPVYNARFVMNEQKPVSKAPKCIEERIQWSIQEKKNSGAILCQSCEKIWDHEKICRLCQLTSG